MPELNTLLNSTSSPTNTAAQPKYTVQYININNLEPSEQNFYNISDVAELTQAIELSGGILQPLLVRRKSAGVYEIIAGHRRWTASKYLVEQGKDKYAMLPCHVQDGDDILARINLITSNSQRIKSDYIKMQELTEIENLLMELATGSDEQKEQFYRLTGHSIDEGEEITARMLRKLTADQAGTSETKVARSKHIKDNLIPELMQLFASEEIGFVLANKLSAMSIKDQQKAYAAISAGAKPSETVPQKPKKTVSTLQESSESIIDSDSDNTSTDDQLEGQMDITDVLDQPIIVSGDADKESINEDSAEHKPLGDSAFNTEPLDDEDLQSDESLLSEVREYIKESEREKLEDIARDFISLDDEINAPDYEVYFDDIVAAEEAKSDKRTAMWARLRRFFDGIVAD